MKTENRTEKTIKKKKRRKKRYMLRFLIFILACIGAYFLLHIEYFTVDGITVAGNKDIADAEIVKLSKLEVGDNIFDVHPMIAQKRIKENLYIEDVDVSRKLPNRIEIVVEERTGKAQFVKDKKFVITDNDGRVLEIAKEEQETTTVMNVTVKKAKVDKEIRVKETAVYDKSMALVAAAETGDLFFKKIAVSGNKVEAYVYDGLVCKGRYEDVMTGIESGALRAVVFDLYQKDIESGVISVGTNNYCSFTP